MLMKTSLSGFLTHSMGRVVSHPGALLQGCQASPTGPVLEGGAAGVTHCFHREGVQCSHTAPLHFPVHRFGWDSPPPHKDLQPLLLKRKTNRNTHNLIFTPMPSSMWSHSELATSVDLVMVRWQIQINKQGSLSGSNDDS